MQVTEKNKLQKYIKTINRNTEIKITGIQITEIKITEIHIT